MSSAELTFWQHVYAKEFVGAERGDLNAAKVEAAVCNFAGRSLKEGMTVKTLECMPYNETQPQKPKRWTRKQVEMQVHSVFGALAKRTQMLKQQEGK